jgi:hypothetical protein
MSKHSEAFVALDTSKLRNAVAIAEGGVRDEVRFLGEIENGPAAISKLVRKLEHQYERLSSAMKQVRPVTSCSGTSTRSGTSALWLHHL